MAWGAAPVRKASPAVPAPVNLYQQQLGSASSYHPQRESVIAKFVAKAVCAVAATATAGAGSAAFFEPSSGVQPA